MSYDKFEMEFQRAWMEHLARDGAHEKMGAFLVKFLSNYFPAITPSLISEFPDIKDKNLVGRGVESFLRKKWGEYPNDNNSCNAV